MLAPAPFNFAGQAISLAQMESLYQSVNYGSGKYECNVITTTTKGFGFIRNNYQTQQRFQNVTIGKAGFRGLEYNGATIMASRYAPGSYLMNPANNVASINPNTAGAGATNGTNDRVAVSTSPTANTRTQQPTQVQPKQPRRSTSMINELNINLKVIGRRNALFDCNWRAVASRSYLRDVFVGASFHRLQRDEDILLVHIETGHDTVDDILKKVAVLSERIDQECIALRWPYGYGNTHGVLVGPKATTWGAWDESKFKRFGSTFHQPERSVAI
jgi:hypothetical protein